MRAQAQETAAPFEYYRAFSRNLGIVTEEEQERLRQSRVAIAGCGGVGGAHAITLARLGVGAFHLADFDRFELENFNRQMGARISTLGERKVSITSGDIRDINPQADVRMFKDGITPANIRDFLKGVDIVVDSLDFFALEARELLFRSARECGLPIVTAAPLGMSCAILVFRPDSMPFERYFDLKAGDSREMRAIKFLVGLAPKGLHRPYMDPKRINLAEGYGPSCAVGIALCAGFAASKCSRLLLKRGGVRPAPFYEQFDAYREKFVSGNAWLGNRHPAQRIKLAITRALYAKQLAPPHQTSKKYSNRT